MQDADWLARWLTDNLGTAGPLLLQAEMKRRRQEQRGDGASVNKKAVRMPGKNTSSFE